MDASIFCFIMSLWQKKKSADRRQLTLRRLDCDFSLN